MNSTTVTKHMDEIKNSKMNQMLVSYALPCSNQA